MSANHPNTNEQFEALYKAEYENMVRYAIKLLHIHGARYISVSGRAEEAVQETFAFAWAERDELLSSAAPVGRLYKTLYYKVMEFLHEDRLWAKRIMQVSESYDLESKDFRLKTEMESILPEEDYSLLKRLYLDGCSYKDLCAEYGLTKSALAMKIKRIKERFRREYKS